MLGIRVEYVLKRVSLATKHISIVCRKLTHSSNAVTQHLTCKYLEDGNSGVEAHIVEEV